MKKIFLLPLLMLSLVGCTYEKEKVHNYDADVNGGVVILCTHTLGNLKLSFIRDTYTENIYVKMFQSIDRGGGGSLSPYYNADGQIMKYSEFVEVHKH